jgi:hypothetical protein
VGAAEGRGEMAETWCQYQCLYTVAFGTETPERFACVVKTIRTGRGRTVNQDYYAVSMRRWDEN